MKVKFTKQLLNSIQPDPKKTLEVYDTEQPKLMVRVSPTGKLTFAVYRRVNGAPKRVKLDRYPDMTIQQARTQAGLMLNEIASGVDPIKRKRKKKKEERQEKTKSTSLSTAFEAFLNARPLKPATVSDYRGAMRVSFNDWMNLPLNSITRAMVEERHRKRSHTSRSRANHAMRVLRAVFNYTIETLVDEDDNPIISSNPVRRLSAVKAWNPNTRKQTYIKPHQLPAWFDAALNLEGERASFDGRLYRDYFQFLLLTGLRKNEAARLKWQDVDLADRSFVVTDTKNRCPHKLPLSDYLLDLLEQRKLTTEYVFHTGRSPGYPADPRLAVEKVVAVSGVQWTPHDLRRTFVTAAERLDISAYSVKRLVNHRVGKADVTDGYIAWDVDRLRAPMQAITDYFLKAGDVRKSEVIPINREKIAE